MSEVESAPQVSWLLFSPGPEHLGVTAATVQVLCSSARRSSAGRALPASEGPTARTTPGRLAHQEGRGPVCAAIWGPASTLDWTLTWSIGREVSFHHGLGSLEAYTRHRVLPPVARLRCCAHLVYTCGGLRPSHGSDNIPQCLEATTGN